MRSPDVVRLHSTSFRAGLALAASVLVLLPTAAHAARPVAIPHSGYLLGADDQPLSESVSMRFRLHSRPDAQTPGDALVWESSACSVAVEDGYYAVVLGETCQGAVALDDSHVPPDAVRWLEVTLGGVPMQPRLSLAPLPNATLAARSLDTQALAARLQSPGVVNAADNPVDFSQLRNVPAHVLDPVDDDTTYQAGGGLALLGGVFSIAPGGVTNQMLQNPSLTVAAGAGLSGGGSVSLGGVTTLSLPTLVASPGTYSHPTLTVDAYGRITSVQSGSVTTGTVTSVGSGAGLAGGPITTAGTLRIADDGVTSEMLQSDAGSMTKVSGGLVHVAAGGVGIGTANPQARLDVRGHVVLEAGSSPTIYTGTGSSELLRYLSLVNSPLLQSASGLKVGGVLVADSYDYANPGKSDLVVKGRVGVGTPSPLTPLDVRGAMILDGGTIYTGTQNAELNRYLTLINSPQTTSASGLKAGGVLVADTYAYADPGKNDLIVRGTVGIGQPGAEVPLDVAGHVNGVSVRASAGIASAGYKNQQDVFTYSDTVSDATWLHLKTNWRTNNYAMYRFKLEGYAYQSGKAINSDCVGYLYGPNDAILNGSCRNYADGISLAQYRSSDGYLVLLVIPTSNYFIGFGVSVQQYNPNSGGARPVQITAYKQAGFL